MIDNFRNELFNTIKNEYSLPDGWRETQKSYYTKYKFIYRTVVKYYLMSNYVENSTSKTALLLGDAKKDMFYSIRQCFNGILKDVIFANLYKDLKLTINDICKKYHNEIIDFCRNYKN
jgi:hypothetical protein